MSRLLRLAIVSDIHHEFNNSGPKVCARGLELLKRFIEFCNSSAIDGVVDLGDRIDDRSPEADLARAREVAEVYQKLNKPSHFIMGNHDSYGLTPSSWEHLLQRPVTCRSWDSHGFHLIFLSTDVDNKRGKFQYQLREDELAWLSADLEKAELPVIIFTHIPLIAGKLQGNFWFEGTEGRAEFLNSTAARRIIDESGKVVLVISGHVHWNSWNNSNGVHYLTLQSLTESYTTHPNCAESFGMLEIDSEISFKVLETILCNCVFP